MTTPFQLVLQGLERALVAGVYGVKVHPQQLADLLGMNRSSISKYENDIGLPHAKTLQKICEIFGVTIDSLLK